jgi:rhodanese-related sulfurtransferase
MKGREFKDRVFEQIASITNAFSSPKRLEIIDILAQGERDVESLARQVVMTIANTSRHLQVLKNVGLVETRREGVRKFYALADDDVLRCWLSLRSLAEKRKAEIREIARVFFEERDHLEPLTKEKLLARMKKKDLVILDVRPEEEYRRGHIAGAHSIPLPELGRRLGEIPRACEVVAYCRGPYCVLSAEAMTILKRAGFSAVRLKEGFPEWRLAGLPMEN